MAAVANPYVMSVTANLHNVDHQPAMTWLQTREEATAAPLIARFRDQIYPTSKTRYRFSSDSRNQAIRAIFEASFARAPQQVIRDAEIATGKSFYPLWKRVCWIHTPRLISSFFGNTCVKIALLAAMGYFGSIAGYQAYAATQHFVAATAVPFVINNTPLQIVRVFNAVMDGLNWVYDNAWTVLFSTWAAQTVILWGPEIPYLTATARVVSVWGLFCVLFAAPQTIGWFLLSRFIDLGSSAWHACNDVGSFFQDVAEKAASERLALSKQGAYQVWVQSLAASH